MKFQLPETLPVTVAELDDLKAKAQTAINAIQSKAEAFHAGVGPELTEDDVADLESLTTAFTTIDTEIARVAESEQTHAARLEAALAGAKAATAPKPAPEPKPEPAAEKAPETPAEPAVEPAAEVETPTEPVAEAAEPVAIAAAAQKPVSFAGAAPADGAPTPAKPATDPAKPWALTAAAPNFAEHRGELVDSRTIAEGICSNGKFTGLPNSRTVLATMERPQDKVIENFEDFYAELDRIVEEGLRQHGLYGAEALVAAGGWCAPSEQQYDFCPTRPAIGLISMPELMIKRGGVIFPAEPDFSALQTGFHYTEAELEAETGGVPDVTKPIVEIPCPPDMVEYRLEAIGWGLKSGILQKRAWPELVKKFIDEFMVEHQYRISAKTVLKVLAQSSAAKVVPTDAVLGATTGILNGLHVRARNIQIKGRTQVVEGIAPIWFRDVLKADLAGRDGLDVLNVTDAQVDAWLAARGIYLQYEGRWQSLGAGQPGHDDTSWWPGSVDVVLYPAGTFWRTLQNVVTVGAQFDLNLLTKNRELVGFVEDEFQVGKRCGPSHLIRIPLCVNGAVGAREHIDCSTEYATKTTKTITVTGGPTGGNFAAKFSAFPNSTASINYNASAANVDTALTGIDDGVSAAGDITTAGGALPTTAVTVTYPAQLGDLTIASKALTGGTSPDVTVS